MRIVGAAGTMSALIGLAGRGEPVAGLLEDLAATCVLAFLGPLRTDVW